MLIVPIVVIGPPVSPVPVLTCWTVPVPVSVNQAGFAAGPPVDKTCPTEPGEIAVHADSPRYIIEPWVLVIALSNNADRVVAEGAADAPLIFAKSVLFDIGAKLIVRLAVKSPPPVRPDPAVIVTALDA